MSDPGWSAGALRVLAPGLYTLIVDRGRPHARSLGVPVGGAADRFALAVGNALVGNEPGAAALEITLAGPTLEATTSLACVLYGAPFDLASDRQPLTPGTTFTLRPGERLHVRAAPHGLRAYLCVRGGVAAPVVLGSRSALAPLRAGDELSCRPGSISRRFVCASRDWELPAHVPADGVVPVTQLRVLDGPQASWFRAEDFFGGEGAPSFVVSPASDRMGLRLQGRPLRMPARELVSEPVCPGTVQVTRDGQCILLGVDGQTIGGYPEVAQVISADLDRVGQLRPGERVGFVRVGLEEAEALYRRRQSVLREWERRLRTAEDLSL
jgi:biotin-dependent carboxylase-like uncharacterized protein